MGTINRRDAEVCHDCRTALQGRVFVAKRNVPHAIYGHGEESFAVTYTDRVPVCAACFTEPHNADNWKWSDCPGCGREMYAYNGRETTTTCSTRCHQRVHRKQRREAKTTFCEMCNIEIKARRQDTRFCSSACRQWAYRQRKRIRA